MQKISLQIEGMTCANCVARVEKKLSKLEGVQTVQVNFAIERASLEYDLAQIPMKQICEEVEKAGYEVVQKILNFKIEGMTCANCSARIERKLTKLAGIVEVNVNLAMETGRVTYLPSELNEKQVLDFVTQMGYPATSDADQEGQKLLSEKEDSFGRKLRIDFFVAAAFTLPLFIIAMGPMLIPSFGSFVHSVLSEQSVHYMSFVLASIVQFVPGMRYYKTGGKALFERSPDMNSLVMLGSSAAWGFSTLVTFWPNLLPENSRGVYFESSAVIITLILLGKLLEARAKGKTHEAIESLLALQPKEATLLKDGVEKKVSIDDLQIGDLILVKPGEKIPIDGTVTEHSSFVDESMISGESIPVEKAVGDALIGGSVNTTGRLVFAVSKIGKDTMLAQIVRTMQDAQSTKAPIQRVADSVVKYFVPVVLVIALSTALLWYFVLDSGNIAQALVHAVAVLIIACPCAMGLATPTSIMVGTGKAAEFSVLFRKGDALEKLANIKAVLFDKTGTLTKGKPELREIVLHKEVNFAESWDKNKVLQYVASIEKSSEHPIAQALVKEAVQKEMTLLSVENFKARVGFGIEAQIGELKILVGSQKLMQEENIDILNLLEDLERIGDRAETPLFFAVGSECIALLSVADALKDKSIEVVAALQARGLEVVMLTGDHKNTALAIAKQLNITHVKYQLLPQDKVTAVKAFQKDLGACAFVGDGINDAPALIQAEVGVAMGSGTDIAIEAADVVLMSQDLDSFLQAQKMSHATLTNIRQNLFWAFAYNAVLIPVAAGFLTPWTGWSLSPMLAAAAMALSSIFVLSNALRLRFVKL